MQIEWGPVRRNCAGMSRRDFLKIGTLAGLGLTLPELVAHREAAAAAGKKPANVIFLFLDGGPSHLETFDMKPEAPSEIRGELKPIETNVAGIQICELLPKTAKVMDHFSILRSMGHPDSNHGAGNHFMTTGQRTPIPVGCGASVSYHPAMGAFAAHEREVPRGLPPYVIMGGGMRSGGPNFLGPAYGPLVVGGYPESDNFRVQDISLPGGVDQARLDARRSLLGQIDKLQRDAEGTSDPAKAIDSFSEKAYDLITSPAAKAAFDIGKEDAKTRELYGRRSHFGQQCLLARRLVEAGVPWVSINWGGWDHHFNLFNDMKRMAPTLDEAFAALMIDLKQRGLLDSTLVVLLGEMGRTPKINAGPGRDHWGPAMSVAIAGAGVPGGTVVGATEKDGSYPSERPLSPQDLACTIFHKMGIDYRKEFRNELGRPTQMINGGELIREIC
ncbi:MAG: DUF1501 domain-containing protein [Armatimonadota bacterium]